MFEGILPGKGEVEQTASKLPEFIPDRAVVRVETEADVDTLPRGALAHLTRWDEDLAYDLVVAGARVTFLDRATKESLDEHEDFDSESFGIIDEQGLWLPGVDAPYERMEGGWKRPESVDAAGEEE